MGIKVGLYNLFRIQYYRAFIVKDGAIIGQHIIARNKTKNKYFRSKKYKAVFILPKITDKSPIRLGVGYLLFYDIRHAFPLKVATTEEDLKNIFGEEYDSVNEHILKPGEFVIPPVDTEELHNFLEAKVTEDILSDNSKEIPMWLIFLISLGIIAVLILAAFYMMTKGQEPVIITQLVTPTPTPTPGYVVIP